MVWGVPLCKEFSSLFELAMSKGAMVAEVWETTRGEGAWNPIFLRSFNDWELEDVQNFICLISSMKVTPMKDMSIRYVLPFISSQKLVHDSCILAMYIL